MITPHLYIFGRGGNGGGNPPDDVIDANNSTHQFVKLDDDWLSGGNIFVNDTINGAPITDGSQVNFTILSVLPAYVTINSDGDIAVNAILAPADLVLNIDYEVCIASTGICATATATLTIYAGSLKYTFANPTSLCEEDGGVIHLTGEGYLTVFSVQIDGVEMPYTIIDFFNIDVNVPPFFTEGVVTLSNIHEANADFQNITHIAPPFVDVITGDDTICVGGGDVLYSNITPTGEWAVSDTDIATITGSGVLTPLAEGTVTVTYTVSNVPSGICTVVREFEVTVSEPVSAIPLYGTRYVMVGGNTQFAAIVSGTAPFTYQWSSSLDAETWTPLSNDGTYSGVTTDTLTISNTPVELSGVVFYQCAITNDCNESLETIVVLFVGATEIGTEPVNQEVCDGDDATFEIAAIGDVVSYQWQEDQGGDNWTNLVDGAAFSGTTTDTLTVLNTTLSQNGFRYKCVITTSGDPVESNPRILTVNNC